MELVLHTKYVYIIQKEKHVKLSKNDTINIRIS